MFARIVHRQGWDVELIEVGESEPQTSNFPDREAALRFVVERRPEWIEVGIVVPAAAETPQHHQWQTLRRDPDGHYSESSLSWGGRPGQARP